MSRGAAFLTELITSVPKSIRTGVSKIWLVEPCHPDPVLAPHMVSLGPPHLMPDPATLVPILASPGLCHTCSCSGQFRVGPAGRVGPREGTVSEAVPGQSEQVQDLTCWAGYSVGPHMADPVPTLADPGQHLMQYPFQLVQDSS